MSNPTALVQKLWNCCNILRDDGLSYGDYVEQLTFLLFLKMADEQAKPPFNKVSAVPVGYDWPSLLAKDGDELESSGARWTAAGSPQGQRGGADQTHYRHVLETLGKRTGMLGVSFRKAQNKIQDPAKLRRFIVAGVERRLSLAAKLETAGSAYFKRATRRRQSIVRKAFTEQPVRGQKV
jgi:type I restriction enzyme M protein